MSRKVIFEIKLIALGAYDDQMDSHRNKALNRIIGLCEGALMVDEILNKPDEVPMGPDLPENGKRIENSEMDMKWGFQTVNHPFIPKVV